MTMSSTKFALLLTLSLAVFYLENAVSVSRNVDDPSSTACTNCTICQYPCHHLSPPPPSPADNPPPPPYPISGCPPYGTPPSQINCTQFPDQCYFRPPPYPLGYQPYESYSASCCSPFYFILIGSLIFSITVLL
ncbi:hypothetical protein MANES_15G059750v8 [Manihot esculenta]|uniref:Uncharacterized protein n=1 Tax=Manihot esculenta TaxID=3983 RepID=A0ACB7G9P0_MANES|nr:hypothetical protein MANES_15G059750v8 [Manihot esculenta]